VKVTVIGQKPNGRVVKRTVTPIVFMEAWGPVWGPFLWDNARDKDIIVDGHRIRVVLHD
jgi:hypothetical protein